MTTCDFGSRRLKISSTATIKARSGVSWIACVDASAPTRNPSGKRTYSAPLTTRTHAQRIRVPHRNRKFDAVSNRAPKADSPAEKNQHREGGRSLGNLREGKETTPTSSGAQLVPGRRPKIGGVTIERKNFLAFRFRPLSKGSVLS